MGATGSGNNPEYILTARKYVEPDGSITLSLDEIDLVCNGANDAEAKRILAGDIFGYAEDFMREFELFSSAPNRKPHIPLVMQTLEMGDIDIISKCIRIIDGDTYDDIDMQKKSLP